MPDFVEGGCLYFIPGNDIIGVGQVVGEAAVKFRCLRFGQRQYGTSTHDAVPHGLNQFDLLIDVEHARLLQELCVHNPAQLERSFLHPSKTRRWRDGDMALTETPTGLWFQEELYADIACGFTVSAVLHRERSACQDILILDTPALGKVLVLDGIVQCAQKDEAIYHEMLAHSGVLLRQTVAPTGGLDVLVVGGGDGGIARECLKHAGVARVTVVDIDPRVRDAVLAHFPELPAGAYADARLTALDADAVDFVRRHRGRFDLIVADTPDPVGVAMPLFGRDFVTDCHAALKEGGVFVRHAGSLLLQTEEFVRVRGDVAVVFGAKHMRTGLLATCSYLGGWFGWLAAVKDVLYPDDEPARQSMRARFTQAALDVRWYSPDVQFAAQVLPPAYAKKETDG